jgi:hypothetical protein
MDGEEEFRLSPAWKHALAQLLARGLSNGDVIEKADLVQWFGLKPPVTAADQERFQLDFMRQFVELRDELLEEHRIALRTMRGEAAYQVIPPADQTDHAMHEGLQEMRRAARKMVRTLAFVRHDELSDDARRKNADAQAKAAMLAGMIRKPRLPGS